MSASTTAEVFYGFITRHISVTRDAANDAADPVVEVRGFGPHGTPYVCAKVSHRSVGYGDSLCLTPEVLRVDDSWRQELLDFCLRHVITWHEPAWHVAPLRL